MGVLAVKAGSLYAYDAHLSAGVGVEHTNNSTKVSENGPSDLKQQANLDLGLSRKGESVDADIGYKVGYIDYSRDTQRDSTEISGNLNVDYRQVENLLVWHLKNSVRNVKRDTALVNTSDNRENRSISSISPEFTFRLSSVDTLQLTPSYTDVSYETSNNDSERIGTVMDLSHSLSSVDSLGLSLNYNKVDFSAAGADYDYYRAVVFYRAQLARINYSVSVGYNETDRDSFSKTISGNYFSAAANYSHGYSSFGLSFLQELTDTSLGNNNDSITGVSPGQDSSTVDIYRRRSLQMDYTTRALCSTCSVNLYLSVEDKNYEGTTPDNVESTAGVRLGYELTRLSAISLDASYTNTAYDGRVTPSDYDEQHYRINWRREVFRDLNLNIYVGYEERTSSEPTREYDELVGGLACNYRFL